MRVLVTDGENRAALAITRALGRLGHDVLVGDRGRQALAQTSRYCRGAVTYPDPVAAPDDFVDGLARLTRDHGVDVLIPVADITTFLVTGNRDRFPCAVPCADAAVIARAANKVDIVDTAERIGVPVPMSVVVHEPAHVPPCDHLGYPLVIKPWQSRIRTPRGWATTSVSYADSPEDLTRDLALRPAHEFPVLLQERLVGPGVGVFACVHQGRMVATFSHRRLRERPPWGGVSVLCESAEVDPVAGGHAIRLLEAIGWQGAAMVEFKRDERDGLPKLMEINGRFWGSLQLAIDAGVNFPALVMQTITGEPFPPQPPYRVGIRERWLWGDVDALLVSLRPGRNAARLAGRSRLRAVRDFLEVAAPDLYYDNPKWDDRAPFVAEMRSWFGKLADGARQKRETDLPRPSASPPPAAVTLMPAPPQMSARAAALDVHFVTSFDAIGLDQRGWNALVAGGAVNSVFMTHQFACNWAAAYGRHRDLLFVVAADSSGVQAVLPLVIDHTTARGRVARFIGDGRADYSDVLARAGDTSLVELMVSRLLASNHWDTLDLHNIPDRSTTPAAIKRCCERAGLPLVFDDDTACPTLLIEGREAEARRILNKPSLRRRENYFARDHSFTVRHLTDAAQILPLLDRFFTQHVDRWAGSTSPSLFRQDENREFYRLLTQGLAGTPWLLFTSVELSGQPIALHYGFDYHGVITWYKPSFDPAFSAHSPGLAMLRQLLEYAVTRQRREVDFTVGDEPFKARFTNHTRRTIRLQVFRHQVRYNLERANRTLRAVVRRAAGA